MTVSIRVQEHLVTRIDVSASVYSRVPEAALPLRATVMHPRKFERQVVSPTCHLQTDNIELCGSIDYQEGPEVRREQTAKQLERLVTHPHQSNARSSSYEQFDNDVDGHEELALSEPSAPHVASEVVELRLYCVHERELDEKLQRHCQLHKLTQQQISHYEWHIFHCVDAVFVCRTLRRRYSHCRRLQA